MHRHHPEWNNLRGEKWTVVRTTDSKNSSERKSQTALCHPDRSSRRSTYPIYVRRDASDRVKHLIDLHIEEAERTATLDDLDDLLC